MIFTRKPARLIAGAIVAQMFSCGLAWIIGDLLGLGLIRSDMFLASLVAVLYVQIFSYNKITKIIGPALLGIAAAVVAYLGLTGGLDGAYDALAPLATLLREGSRAVESDTLLLAGRIVAALCGVVGALTAGGLRGGGLLGASTLFIIVFSWYSGAREQFGCAALCAAATAAVSAAGFARRREAEVARALEAAAEPSTDASSADAPKRRRSRRSKRGEPLAPSALLGSPRAAALLIVPITLLIALAGTLFRPVTFARMLRVQVVEGALDDAIDSIAQNFDGFSRRTTVFSLGAVGYGPAADLGGPVSPTDTTTLVVDVNRDYSLHYLRGSVRSVYDGDGWSEGELSGSYRYSSALWKEQKSDVFDLLRGGMADANRYFLGSYDRVGYSIKHYTHLTSMFTLERPEEVESRLYTPYFNLQGELFPKGQMESGSSYTVSGYAQRRLTKTVVQYLDRLIDRYSPDDEEFTPDSGAARSEFEEKLYEEYLPGGEVEISVGEDSVLLTPSSGAGYARGADYYDEHGWVHTPRSLLASSLDVLGAYTLVEREEVVDDAKAWTPVNSVQNYYLFYGYTAEQLEQIEKNDAQVKTREQWLQKNRPGEDHVEALGELIDQLQWPQAEAFWLSETELAAYGISAGEEFLNARIDPSGEIYWARRDGELLTEDYRAVNRRLYALVSDSEAPTMSYVLDTYGEQYRYRPQLGDSSRWALLDSENLTEEELETLRDNFGEVLIETGEDGSVRYYVRVTNEEYIEKVPLDSVVGGTREYFYDGSTLADASEQALKGLAALAEEHGFARLEYAGSEQYYPGLTEEVAYASALNYLTSVANEDGEYSPFELLLEVAQTLAATANYTYSPAPVPDGVDFVDWFLSTNEGYCTYYASAMVLMARELGIPARYAEGYIMANAEKNPNGVYELNGYDAHAWAEVWFDGVGWITLDPLALDLLDYEEPDTDDDVRVEVEVPVPSVEPSVAPAEDDEEPPVSDAALPWWAVLLIAVGAAVLAAAVGFAAARALVVRARSLKVLRLKHGDRGAAKELWAEIVRALERLEPLCERGVGETAREYAERVHTLVFVEGTPFVEVAEAAEAAWYRVSAEPTERELELLDRCACEQRRRMFRRWPLKLRWMFK